MVRARTISLGFKWFFENTTISKFKCLFPILYQFLLYSVSKIKQSIHLVLGFLNCSVVRFCWICSGLSVIWILWSLWALQEVWVLHPEGLVMRCIEIRPWCRCRRSPCWTPALGLCPSPVGVPNKFYPSLCWLGSPANSRKSNVLAVLMFVP